LEYFENERLITLTFAIVIGAVVGTLMVAADRLTQ
jgi:hypothetical protein